MYTRKYEITMTELWKITANSQVNFTITTEQNDFFGVRTWNNSLAEIFLLYSLVEKLKVNSPFTISIVVIAFDNDLSS